MRLFSNPMRVLPPALIAAMVLLNGLVALVAVAQHLGGGVHLAGADRPQEGGGDRARRAGLSDQ